MSFASSSSIVFSTDPHSDLADPSSWRCGPASEAPACTILSTERVLPLQRAEGLKEWSLCPSDWLMGSVYTIRTVLFYDASDRKARNPSAGGAGVASAAEAVNADDELLALPRLRRALQALLVAYPILCGRFVSQSDGTVKVVADASCKGVPLVSTSIAAPLSSLPLKPAEYKTQRQITPWPLVTDFDYSDAVAQDIFTLTLSRFSCGSVCLGVHMHHWLGDAESIFTLLNDLAELYNKTGMRGSEGGRGSDAALRLDIQPCIDRSCLLVEPAQVAELTKDFQPTVYEVAPDAKLLHESPPAADDASSASSSPTPAAPERASMWRVWRFGVSELAAIKAAATASMSVPWVSTFEALTSHVVRCVTRARAIVARNQSSNGDASSSSAAVAFDADAVCRCNLFVNFRPRLHSPALPHKLFANGVLMAQARVPMSIALSDDPAAIGAAASVMHSTLEGFTESTVRSTLAWVSAQPDKSRIGLRDSPLIVTSWTKFPVYAVAFDGVHPTRVTFPFAESAVDGIITLIDAPPSESGAIDVYQGIHHDTAVAMERDPEWRKFRAQ